MEELGKEKIKNKVLNIGLIYVKCRSKMRSEDEVSFFPLTNTLQHKTKVLRFGFHGLLFVKQS